MSKWFSSEEHVNFSDLKGKTLIEIIGDKGSEELIFKCDDGTEYKMWYEKDCCANCEIEDIEGYLNDLIGAPILHAEESTNSDNPRETPEPYYDDDSFTWTFYKASTIKGSVTIRWYGSSNGYYSEEASFAKVK